MARLRKPTPLPTSREMPVGIDPAFVRVFADQALVMDLGRDVDFAFLAVGPRLDRVTRTGSGDDESAQMKLRPQLNEVARVRMAPLGAVTLAMSLLQAMISSGQANKSAVLEALEAVEGPAPATDPAAIDEDEQDEA